MGRGEIILRDEHGTLAGATEPRTDGCVAAW
jgi:gamma-glutamyltranspeptidase/glutathione hydrolase